jgi:hypothetical protein
MDQDPLRQMSSQLRVLDHLLRMIMRERGIQKNQTPAGVLAYSEKLKKFFESNRNPGDEEMYIDAEVDVFFQGLACDLQKHLENQMARKAAE